MSAIDISEELFASMHQQLVKQANTKPPSLLQAANNLHAALDILDSCGLYKQANQVRHLLHKMATTYQAPPQAKTITITELMHNGITQNDLRNYASGSKIATQKIAMVLQKLGFQDTNNEDEQEELIAQAKKNKKKPTKTKSDRHTKGLTPERQIKNLSEHGTVFNMADDKGDKDLDTIRQDVPDYEPCGECGFDHSYEPEEAHKWHKNHEVAIDIPPPVKDEDLTEEHLLPDMHEKWDSLKLDMADAFEGDVLENFEDEKI